MEMNINCLYEFNSLSKFAKFTEFVIEKNWKIEKQLLKNRAITYSKMQQFKTLKERFYERKISIFALKDEEVITWIDTICLLRKILFGLYKKGVNTENLMILMEYPVVFGNHMRTDYVLVYNRLIVVLEFGMFNQDEKRSEERYTKKLQESISYRQMLQNIVTSEIKVINYVMIYKPEYDRVLDDEMIDNIAYNDGEIERLITFLKHHIDYQDDCGAKQQLLKIAKYD